MVINKTFIAGFASAILLVGCVSVSFPYKYFDPQFVNYDGALLGAHPEDDLPGTSCAPQPGLKHPCVVMFAKDFFSMKTEYMDMQNRLNQCQAPTVAGAK